MPGGAGVPVSGDDGGTKVRANGAGAEQDDCTDQPDPRLTLHGAVSVPTTFWNSATTASLRELLFSALGACMLHLTVRSVCLRRNLLPSSTGQARCLRPRRVARGRRAGPGRVLTPDPARGT